MSNVHRGVYQNYSYPEYYHRLPYHCLPRVTQLNYSPHFTPPVPTCFLRIAFCPTNSYCPMFPSPVLQRHQLHPPQPALHLTYLHSRSAIRPPPAASHVQPPPPSLTSVAPPLAPPHTSSDPSIPSSSHTSPSTSSCSLSAFDEDEQSKYQKVATQLQRTRLTLGYSHTDVGKQLGLLSHTVFGGSTVSCFESGKMPLYMVRKIQPAIQAWLHAAHSKNESEQLHTLGADRKRPRAMIDQYSKERLEEHFKTCSKPLPNEIMSISDMLGLDKGIVQTWFCNRRQREKRKAAHRSRVIPSSSHDITLVVDDPSSTECAQSIPVYIDQPPN